MPTPLPPQSPSKTFFPSDSTTPIPDMLGKQIDSFRILKLLGVGAFSKVYLAQHVDTCEFYAMKLVPKLLVKDTRVRASIEREISILKVRTRPQGI